MARVPTTDESSELKAKESKRVRDIRHRFKKQGKEFIVPDDHWSGVMPEKYRSRLPGKKEDK